MSAPVGRVCVTVAGDSVTIRVSAADGFVIREVQLAVAPSLDGIPQAEAGAPQIGRFPVRTDYNPGVRTTTHALGLEVVARGGDSLFIAVHASTVDPSGVEHGSWGAGRRFQEPGPPATYFTVPIAEAGCDPWCEVEGLRSRPDAPARVWGPISHVLPLAAFRLEG